MNAKVNCPVCHGEAADQLRKQRDELSHELKRAVKNVQKIHEREQQAVAAICDQVRQINELKAKVAELEEEIEAMHRDAAGEDI